MQAAAKKERIALWDNLRLILIFLVVLGHIADRYTGESVYMRMVFFFIYTFHMPAFIFVSGMFCKRTVDSKNYTAMFSYLVLYIMVKILTSAANTLNGLDMSFYLLSVGSVPWYVLALFAFCLMTVFLRRFKPSYVMALSIILACFIGYDKELGDTLAIMRIIVFYPFFFAGYTLKDKKVAAAVKKIPVKIGAVLLLAALGVGVYFGEDRLYQLRPLLSGRNPFSTLGEFADFGVLLRLAYYPLAFLLIFAVIALAPSKKIPLLTAMGSRTVQVYAIHILAVDLVYYAFDIDKIALSIFPSAPHLITVPLAAAITAVCALKIFEKPFACLLHPPLKSAKN